MCQSCRKPCACSDSLNGAAHTHAGYPDTMRHGRLPFEVRGSDRSTHGVHPRGTLNASATVTNPATNQQETGVVGRSEQGQAIKRNMHNLVRQMEPIIYLHKFLGDIGVLVVRNMTATPIVYDSSYDGILPMTRQPRVNKPLPYA